MKCTHLVIAVVTLKFRASSFPRQSYLEFAQTMSMSAMDVSEKATVEMKGEDIDLVRCDYCPRQFANLLLCHLMVCDHKECGQMAQNPLTKDWFPVCRRCIDGHSRK